MIVLSLTKAMVLSEEAQGSKIITLSVNYINPGGIRFLDLKVAEDIPIKDLRAQIAKEVKKPVKSFQLFYRFILLTDEHDLKYYNVGHKGPIYAIGI